VNFLDVGVIFVVACHAGMLHKNLGDIHICFEQFEFEKFLMYLKICIVVTLDPVVGVVPVR
jgi:hypothetical protein